MRRREVGIALGPVWLESLGDDWVVAGSQSGGGVRLQVCPGHDRFAAVGVQRVRQKAVPATQLFVQRRCLRLLGGSQIKRGVRR